MSLRLLIGRWWPAALLACLVAWRVLQPGAGEYLQAFLFDSYQSLSPRSATEAKVAVVDIDDESLRRLGPWPWPRTRLAELVRRLGSLGTAVIAFDIVFPEPDRTSPKEAVRAIPERPSLARLRKAVASLPDHDEDFAAAVAKAPVVLGFTMSERESAAAPARKGGIAHVGEDPRSLLPDFPGAVSNLPVLEEAASGIGCFSAVAERDGVVRRAATLFRKGGELYPALALEALRVAQGSQSIIVRSVEGIEKVSAGSLSAPTDPRGRLWIHYARSPGPVHPVWRVLDPGFDGSTLKGAVVFIGASAMRLRDLRATPLAPAVPGVEIHAQIAGQILEGSRLRRPDWVAGAELAWLALLGIALVLLVPRLGAAWCGVAALIVLAASFAVSWLAYTRFEILFDPLFPALASIATFMAAALQAYRRSETERRRLLILDQIKDELISTVSHDLRGPVGSMMMVVDGFKAGLYGTLTDKQTQKLAMMRASGQKLINFVNNILDAAKIKAGRMELVYTDIRPGDVIAGIVDFYAMSAGARGLKLESRIEEGLPAVRADQEKLEQVLNNLIGNAMKFTAEGGAVTVAAQRDGEAVRFSVADTGAGIAAEDIPKLFRKFGQVDLEAQREKKVKGTGLGLSICKAVAEAHGGRIWVESEKGRGSSFLFTIPVDKAGAGELRGAS